MVIKKEFYRDCESCASLLVDRGYMSGIGIQEIQTLDGRNWDNLIEPNIIEIIKEGYPGIIRILEHVFGENWESYYLRFNH